MSEIIASADDLSTELYQRKLAEANALKDEGNRFLSSFKYKLAEEKYTQAIKLVPTAIFYSNRSQAQIKQEAYASAIADANEAIK